MLEVGLVLLALAGPDESLVCEDDYDDHANHGEYDFHRVGYVLTYIHRQPMR